MTSPVSRLVAAGHELSLAIDFAGRLWAAGSPVPPSAAGYDGLAAAAGGFHRVHFPPEHRPVGGDDAVVDGGGESERGGGGEVEGGAAVGVGGVGPGAGGEPLRADDL